MTALAYIAFFRKFRRDSVQILFGQGVLFMLEEVVCVRLNFGFVGGTGSCC